MKRFFVLLLTILTMVAFGNLAWSQDDEEAAPKKKEKPAAKEITAAGTFETVYNDDETLKSISFKVDEKTSYNLGKSAKVQKMALDFKGQKVKITGALRGKMLNIKTCEAVVENKATENESEEEAPEEEVMDEGDDAF